MKRLSAAVLAAMCAGCTYGAGPPVTSTAPADVTIAVGLTSFAAGYAPADVTVTVGTRVRFVPFTTSYQSQIVVRPMAASQWFIAGSGSPGANFGAACDDRGWHHIHYSVQDDAFGVILADMYTAA